MTRAPLDRSHCHTYVRQVSKSRDNRVIARLDEEERALLERVRSLTGQNTSAVMKAALRAYAKSLLDERSPLDIFRRHGVVGAASGPTDLSETYKEQIDYSSKHGEGST